MGYIKEPKGVDLVVGPSELTNEDISEIQKAISAYRKSHSTFGVRALVSKSLKAMEGPYDSYASRPKTLAVTAKDGKIHHIKVTSSNQFNAKPVKHTTRRSTGQ